MALRVAVIGGGSAGVTTARYLAAAGHLPTVFESGAALGGIWADVPENKVVYDSLKTNLPTQAMQSFDLDFPQGLPSYVSAGALGNYISDYAAKFLGPESVHLETRVTAVAPLDGGAGGQGSGWRVSWASSTEDARGGGAGAGANGCAAECMAEFDAVAVASGHYEKAYVPTLRGQGEWLAHTEPIGRKREVLHSRDWKRASDHAGQSVLVIGGRSSGVDIAREMAAVSSCLYVLEKDCGTAKTYANEFGNEACKCVHVPRGASLGADGWLRMPDGEHLLPLVEREVLQPVETVILATGYEYSFEFLDAAQPEIKLENGRGDRYIGPLYQHIIHADRPTLAFIGIPLSVPCPIPFFECQARFLANFWAEGLHRRDSAAPAAAALGAEQPQHPGRTAERRHAWVAERVAAVGPDRPMDRHFMGAGGTDAWQHMRELMALAGLSAEEHQQWDRRLTTVRSIYSDRVQKRPMLPWGDDEYRRYNYTADWDTGQWEVEAPPGGDAAAL
jgi:hypothetical protein